MARFTVKETKEVQVVPKAVQEFITFLHEQEHRLSQAAYELNNDVKNHLDAIEESGLTKEDYESLYRLVNVRDCLGMAAHDGDNGAAKVQELINKIEGNDD